MIRHYGEAHEEVLTALLRGIARIAPAVRRDEDRATLLEEAEGAIAASARWPDEMAKRRIAGEYQRTIDALGRR